MALRILEESCVHGQGQSAGRDNNSHRLSKCDEKCFQLEVSTLQKQNAGHNMWAKVNQVLSTMESQFNFQFITQAEETFVNKCLDSGPSGFY
jgi:hypothetical protein